MISPALSQTDIPPHSENVDEELSRIQLALGTVFSATNQGAPAQAWWQHRNLADRYLTSFQSTTVSWMVCDRLLQEGDGQTIEERSLHQQRRFFAAQTLHTKCRTDIHQVPEASLLSLRDSLLAHLHRYSVGDDALTTRLALCVSALAVQMQWTTIVSDLLSSPSSDRMLLLLVLRVLPEECSSGRLLLFDESKRFRMRDHLVGMAHHVFKFLQEIMTADVTQTVRVLEAFHTWIRNVPVLPASLLESQLLQTSVQAMREPQLLEHAADVVVEVLRMYPSHINGNEALVQLMIPLLSQLPLDEALQSDDEDVWRAYCRVVTEMGESYMSLILSTEHKQASQLVEWVLKCSAITDPEIACITLHFWYRMVMDLEVIDPYDYRQELVDVYSPHLLSLIDVCVSGLMRYPPDVGDLPEDRLDDFHKHRFYVSETVEDCCHLLGGHNVLKRIGEIFRIEIQKVSSGRQYAEWQGIESCLSCIVAIHRFVPSDESDVLPLCFKIIPELPTDILPLRFTASKTVGKFASWLAMHSDYMQPLLPYLANGLSVPDTAPAAAVAIKELCECSNSSSFAIAEPVMQLYQEIATHPGRLELADELQILEGVCRALSRQIQDTTDNGTAFLVRLAQPIGTQLAAAVADPTSTPRRILPEIERLTVLLQFLVVPLNPPNNHPFIDLMSSTWALLNAATNRFPTDTMLAEKICRLHKHAMRAVGAKAYAPVLDALIQELVQSFDRTHQSPFLYAASICITEYGNDSTYSLRLMEMVATMARTAFSFLRTQEEMTNFPDVVEEFFYLMGRMVSYCPDPLLTSSLLQSLFQCAAIAMRCDHHGSNKGTLKFIENTISYGLQLREQNKPECQRALENVLAIEGQAIANNLALAMMGDLPSHSNQIPEILWKLNLLCPGLLVRWLSAAFSSSLLPERAKNDFMGALDTGLARDEFSLAARAFQSACERERKFRKRQASSDSY
jgi:transportin-3